MRQSRQDSGYDAPVSTRLPVPSTTYITIGCRTCSITLAATLLDPEEGPREAASFFDRHAECLTFVDLDPIRQLLD